MHRRLPALLGLLLAALIVACGAPADSAVLDPDVPTATPGAPATPIPTPTLIPTPVSATIIDRYTVRSGETLGGIANRNDITIDELMKLNGLTNPNSLKVGQVLKISTQVTRMGPPDAILPDSEVVYGPSYAGFDVAAFASQAGGYLAGYREKADGETLSGPQIIQLVSERFSVGPRALLALLEFETGWVTDATLTQDQVQYPMGLQDSTRSGLFYQASWAANRLNEGYYGKLNGQLAAFRFKDRTRSRINPNANPGTVAIQNVLAQLLNWDTWQKQVSPEGYRATYIRLFGDPSAVAVDPIVPTGLVQPVMRLPWNDGSTWYYTGGPHSAWGDASAWAAIDLTPGDVAGSGSCNASRDWVIAAAPGKVVRSERGRVIVSLDPSGSPVKGWAMLYMHVAADGRAAAGTQVKAGDRIGHPSCEGGDADASHVHIARMYNGQWIDPQTVPFVMSGWQITALDRQYDGTMERGGDKKEAHDGRDEGKNGIVADPPR